MAKSKALLPKRVAGFKVPKTLRRGKFAKFLASPAGAAVMVAAIDHISEAALTRDSTGTTGVRRAFRAGVDKVRHTTHDVAENAFSHAVRAGLNAFSETLREYRMARRNGDWMRDEDEDFGDEDRGPPPRDRTLESAAEERAH
jgi:hypothetical protein